MTFSRREFIASGAAAVASPAFSHTSGKPELRFGLISDSHFERKKGGRDRRMRSALEWFRSMEAEAVVCTGDLTHTGMSDELENFASVWREVFPGDSLPDGRRVEKVFVCGNHDTDPSVIKYSINSGREAEFRKSSIQSDPDRIWRKCFGEPFESVFIKKIKGYAFVGSHWTDSPSSVAVPGFLEAHRAELEGSKPFFYCQHAPLRGTVNPRLGHFDNGKIKKKLDSFPNAFAFSGHSHNALTDETSIWQGAFTAVGAGCLVNSGRRYSSPWYENSDVPGSAAGAYIGRKGSQMPVLDTSKDGSQGLLVDVFPDRVVFRRRSFHYNIENGPDWVVPVGEGRAKPYAFDGRKSASVPPCFGADAEIDVIERDGFNREREAVRQLAVSFPATESGARPFGYEVGVTSVSGTVKPLVKHVLSPDFHLPPSRRVKKAECVFAVAGLPPADDRRITVRAYDSFMNAGRELTWRRKAASADASGGRVSVGG